MASRRYAKGLDGRQRDQSVPKAGQIREKRSDTLVRTLREEYESTDPALPRVTAPTLRSAGSATTPERASIS